MMSEQKQAFLQAIQENKMVHAGIDGLDVYVKTLNVGEMNELIAQEEQLAGLSDQEKAKASVFLYAFDTQGEPFFDRNNPDDVALVEALPWRICQQLLESFNRANFGDWLAKGVSTLGKNS